MVMQHVAEQHTSTLPQTGDVVGEYRIVKELGRGGMALVLEGLRESDGARHAIKLMLPSAQDDDLAVRFHREFRTLSHLEHPNVLQVFGTGIHKGRPYFSMELLEGRELRDDVEAWRSMPPAQRFARARHILLELARALEYIHDRGWVHRDITPSNIMLLADEQVKLMDFGVVKEPGADMTVVGEVVGTVAYISPEQIRGEPLDARADLYSLGAVLYFMLTGRRPFNARTLAGYLDKHLNQTPRPPHEVSPTVPRDLDAICMRLLAKDPDDRFASATHLLFSLSPQRPDQVPDLSMSLAGRARERATLREMVALLDGGKGSVLVIEGDSGMGCSRLIAEGVRLTRQQGPTVIWSQNQTPTQPSFLGLRQAYRTLTANTPAPPSLVQAFEGSEREEHADLYAVCVAFRDLLVQAAPLMLCVEDIDRADRGTLEVIEYLVRNLAGHPVLFLFSQQPTATNEPTLNLQDATNARQVHLAPLSVSAVEELVLHHAHTSSKTVALAKRLHRESEGNPFIIEQMLNGLLKAGIIDNYIVTLSEAELENAPLPIPRSIREALEKQLRALSADALEVARLVGLARQEMDIERMRLAVEMDEEELEDALDELLAANLLKERHVGGTEQFELIHLRLQDVLIDATPLVARRALHHRLGLSLETLNRHNVEPIVELLAHHFDESGSAGKAYTYMIWAAEKQNQQAFLSDALRFLDRAVELEPQTRAHMPLIEAETRRVDVLLKRSNALYHLGRWDAAVDTARQADTLAQDLSNDELLARTATELACQARSMNQYEEASSQLDRALSHAKSAGDDRLRIVPLYEIGALRWSDGDLSVVRPWLEEALKLSEQFGDIPGLALGTNGLGVLAMCEGRSAEARRYFDQAITVCESHGLMERLAISRTNLAELAHCMGNIRKGLALADRTITTSREVNHRYGVSIGLRYRALLLGDLGHWAEAEENAVAAMKLQQALGNRDEELASTVALTRIIMAVGQHERAWALLDRCLELTGDFDTERYLPVVHAWRAQLHAQAGDLQVAKTALENAAESDQGWPHMRLRQLLNMARAWRMVEEPEQSKILANEALQLAEACGYRYYTMRARQTLLSLQDDGEDNARHQRIAEAQARALAAALAPEDAAAFLNQQGLEVRVHQRRRLKTRG